MSQRQIFSILLIVMFLWGISWISAKYIAMHFSHIELTFWRFLLVFISSLISLKLLGLKFQKVPLMGILWISLGAISMGLSQFTNFMGLEHGYAGFGSIVFNATSPLFSFLLAMLFFSKKLTKKEYLGLFMGAFGVMTLFNIWHLNFEMIFSPSNIYFILNSLTFAIVTLCSQLASRYTNSVTFSLGLSLIASSMILPFCDAKKLFDIFTLDAMFWAHLIFNAVIAGGFGTTAYFYVAGKIGSEKVSSYIYLTPIVSTIASYFVYQESLNWSLFFGGLISMSAVYLLTSQRKKKTPI